MALAEVYHSRVQEDDARYIHFIQVWTCDHADIVAGEAGWVGNTGITLPTRGDAYAYGDWTGKVTPRLRHRNVDPRESSAKVRITGYFTAPRVYGD